tara:strand:+ start:47 stop:538 length:492 start_codon:yes stop_codon:yes gene_type:complete
MINKIVTIRDRLLLLKSIIDTLGYCYQELKLLKKKHAFTLSEIAEVEFNIGKINLDIEIIEDPYMRPLGTGEESPRIEKLIRSMESEIKYLDNDLSILIDNKDIYKADINLYRDEISEKLSRLKEIKEDIDTAVNPDEDFEKTFGQFLKQAESIEAEYTRYDY